jgi:hypothetical protein
MKRIYGDLHVHVSYASDVDDPSEYNYTRAKVKIFRVGEPSELKRMYYTLLPDTEMTSVQVDSLAFTGLMELVEYCPNMAVVAGPDGARALQAVKARRQSRRVA